uniref:Uncharacterized protein n=1 Tax=Acrobeloides nanus TaxID=290746 RepID=A0A914BVW0_9BILA
MKSLKNLREAIIRVHNRGKGQREIADFLGISPGTANKAIKRVWSILEEKACPKPHPNVESLKRALLKAWDEIDVETLAKIVDNFPKRLEKCVAANGGHFE